MTKVTVAALQLAFSDDMADNVALVADHVTKAAARGAKIILPPELFEGPYFCRVEDEALFATAQPTDSHLAVQEMRKLAKDLGVYRKSHIPDGPGYEEKYYFRPGNSGFKVWNTRHGTIGVGICWDQWYPETARCMALMGAEMLFYPTAIGSEPYDADLDTSRMWRRAMIGHAVSNCMPVIAANRIGEEEGQTFYGHSFVSDEWGDFVSEAGAKDHGALVATLDLERARIHRAGMGFFRDRRPELYARIAQDI